MDDYITLKKALLEQIHIATSGDPTVNEYLVLHKEILDTSPRLINQQHYDNLKTRLQSFSEVVDDLEISKCITVLKCPLTQDKIRDPFYSSCGHVFEKQVILDYLKKNTKVCPTVGCRGVVQEK